jgi:16S rRNA (guanine966-N2)-methyltransferase
MQRVEAGSLRGRRLRPLPRGVDGLRPTSARVRGAICDRLASQLRDARVLDLFAGSGALSIEALSRGAAEAWLVDRDPRVVRHLVTQLDELGLSDRARVVRDDAVLLAERGPTGTFDVVFVDPPFATPQVCEPLARALVRGWLEPGAVVVCERERIRGTSPPVAWPAALPLEVSKVYGQAQVDFLRYVPPSPQET